MSARPFKLKPPEPQEAQVLRGVLQLLAHHPKVAWAHRFNTAAGKLVRGKGQSQFIRFGFPGCPDVIGMLKGGRSLLLEVKKPSGTVTPEQAAFIARAQADGACAAVVRSVDDALQLLDAQ